MLSAIWLAESQKGVEPLPGELPVNSLDLTKEIVGFIIKGN